MQFKDEYKRHNVELSSEIERLRLENSRLFSTAIEERNVTIAQLQQTSRELQEKVALTENQLRFVYQFFNFCLLNF